MPIHACTGRHVVAALDRDGRRRRLEGLGVVVVADTCVVVTPILPSLANGVLMTNSGKFAHYAPGNTGYGVIYGSLADCVESAVAGTAGDAGARRMSGLRGVGSRGRNPGAGRRRRGRGPGALRAHQLLGRRRSEERPHRRRQAPAMWREHCRHRAVHSGHDRLVIGRGRAARAGSCRPCAGRAGAARTRCDPAARPDRGARDGLADAGRGQARPDADIPASKGRQRGQWRPDGRVSALKSG